MYYDRSDKTDSMIRDINHKHTPDSVRQDAERELRDRGYSEHEITRMKIDHPSWRD